MVISFVAHKIEWFTLLKFVFVWRVCQTQMLQFPIVGVYGVPDVKSTKIKYNSTVMDICDENLRQSI